MLLVKNLSKQYGESTAVSQVNFELEKGKKLILLGTSGSGKTTTLKMINRLVEPTTGNIFIDQVNINQQNPVELRKNIGYVIQNAGLFPHYTVAQNIGLVPWLLKWEAPQIESRTQELMEMLDLDPSELLHRYPRELSGGQRQRVGVARALAVDPPLMLLDEPFGALDPITRHQIVEEFKRIESLAQKTVVMVTHDVFEALDLGDFICLMDQGKIQQWGEARELIFKPKNTFVKEFFDSNRFQIELKVSQLRDILPYVSSQEDTGERRWVPCQEDISLLDLMEKTAHLHEAKEGLFIQDKTEKGGLRALPSEIMRAFYKYKEHFSY